jgi:GT2 family glycosyltransferase
MHPKVAIVLLNWNGKKDTLECLDSLSKITYDNYEILLVDNGSHDGSVETLQSAYPELSIIETYANLGYAGGNNVGIDHALQRGADFILLLNNDTSVPPSFLNAFLEAAQEKPRGGVFGAKVLCYQKPDTIDQFGGMWNEKIAEFESIGRGRHESHFNEMMQVDYVSGCALFIRKEVFQKIGKIEQDFFLLWEETDFCYRAKKAGFEIWTVPKAFILHKISASFSGKALMHYYWWRNRLLWIERNCTASQKRSLYLKILIKEMFKIHKLNTLKTAQHWIYKTLFPQKITDKKVRELKRYKAGCKGIRDYFLRRFGGPVSL